MNAEFRAVLVGDAGRPSGRNDRDLAARLRNLDHFERRGAVGHVDHHVDLAPLEPIAGDPASLVRFVVMIGVYEFDRRTGDGATEILDRHARGEHRAGPGKIFVKGAHVGDDSDPDDAVRNPVGGLPRLGRIGRIRGWRRGHSRQCHNQDNTQRAHYCSFRTRTRHHQQTRAKRYRNIATIVFG